MRTRIVLNCQKCQKCPSNFTADKVKNKDWPRPPTDGRGRGRTPRTDALLDARVAWSHERGAMPPPQRRRRRPSAPLQPPSPSSASASGGRVVNPLNNERRKIRVSSQSSDVDRSKRRLRGKASLVAFSSRFADDLTPSGPPSLPPSRESGGRDMKYCRTLALCAALLAAGSEARCVVGQK